MYELKLPEIPAVLVLARDKYDHYSAVHFFSFF